MCLLFGALFVFIGTGTVFAEEPTGVEIVGSWETAAFIDGEMLVTRVNLDSEGVVPIALKDFIEFFRLGSHMEWRQENHPDRESRRLSHLSIGANKCDANGSMMYLSQLMYVDYDVVYIALSTIERLFIFEAFFYRQN